MSVRNARSNAFPANPRRVLMLLPDIIPGIPPAEPLMWCPMDGIAVGWPHWRSHPFIVVISGSWAPRICSASFFTCGLPARLAARAAISMACSWCGIIIRTNMRSAVLWPAADLLASVVGVDLALVVDLGLLLPQAARVPAASTAASRTGMRFTCLFSDAWWWWA